MGSIETLQLEERRYPPPPEFAAQANAQPEIYDRNPDEFWETEARERVTWFEPFTKLCEWELRRSPRTSCLRRSSRRRAAARSMRRLLRDVAEQRPLGDTTTLADPAVVSEIQTRAETETTED